MEVYSHNAHNAVRFVPSVPESNNNNNNDNNQQQRAMYAITDIIPPEHRSLARERLGEYQDAYLNTYRSGTALGDWLESRPVSLCMYMLHYISIIMLMHCVLRTFETICIHYESDYTFGREHQYIIRSRWSTPQCWKRLSKQWKRECRQVKHRLA